MCICCESVFVIKPMSEFTASELASANSCCLKPSDDWDESVSIQDIKNWVDSMLFDLSQDDDELLAF